MRISHCGKPVKLGGVLILCDTQVLESVQPHHRRADLLLSAHQILRYSNKKHSRLLTVSLDSSQFL